MRSCPLSSGSLFLPTVIRVWKVWSSREVLTNPSSKTYGTPTFVTKHDRSVGSATTGFPSASSTTRLLMEITVFDMEMAFHPGVRAHVGRSIPPGILMAASERGTYKLYVREDTCASLANRPESSPVSLGAKVSFMVSADVSVMLTKYPGAYS